MFGLREFLMTKPPPAPKRPRLAGRMLGLPPSLYTKILSRLQRHKGEVFPFHIGETHLLPVPEVMDALRQVDDAAVHHYGHPKGILELRSAIADHLQARGQPDVTPEDVVVTHGATHGLNLACQAILDPGDVMLVLSPHWPLINHMVHTACAVPVEVPFSTRLRHENVNAYDILKENILPRVRAVYVTSPNNPDGVVLRNDELADIARFCTEHDLYALVDEAYDSFHFGKRYRKMSSFPGMAERTISVHTFSKSFRMAGLRVGYNVAPPDVRHAMTRLANISIYNVSLLTQRAALRALNDCIASVEETVQSAKEAASYFCDQLDQVAEFQFLHPEGGAYVFANLTEILQGQDAFAFLGACLDVGIVFAPGAGFGKDYANYGRFCFTAMAPDHLERGATLLLETARKFQKNH